MRIEYHRVVGKGRVRCLLLLAMMGCSNNSGNAGDSVTTDDTNGSATATSGGAAATGSTFTTAGSETTTAAITSTSSGGNGNSAGTPTGSSEGTPTGSSTTTVSSTSNGGSIGTMSTAGTDTVTGGSGGSGGSGGNVTGQGEIVEVLDIAEVWSGHPVEFSLYTFGQWQFAAFYNADRAMTVVSRSLGETSWETMTLPTTLGWDSHNHVVLGLDEQSQVHVSGNMHNVPLIYFRTETPLDITSLHAISGMVGSNEQSVTYPEFFTGPNNTLLFAYRDGGSGNGNHIFNRYDASSEQWSRLLDAPLTDGQGQYNAYPVGPIQGPDGYWHIVWVWRDTPDASTNHDLSYARTGNLVDWETAAGTPLNLPITLGTGDIADAVPAGGGMINNNTKVGFDAENRPIIAYHKYDSNGNTQLYNARFENGSWVVHQTSNWDYRWDFGGGGTLVFEIEVEPVEVGSDGTLTQRYYHAQYGGWGAFQLNHETLAAEADIDPPLPYPRELDTPESPTPGMVTRWREDSGMSPDAGVVYLLRWETLPSNRDEPRSTIPPPTMLRLYGFSTGQ